MRVFALFLLSLALCSAATFSRYSYAEQPWPLLCNSFDLDYLIAEPIDVCSNTPRTWINDPAHKSWKYIENPNGDGVMILYYDGLGCNSTNLEKKEVLDQVETCLKEGGIMGDFLWYRVEDDYMVKPGHKDVVTQYYTGPNCDGEVSYVNIDYTGIWGVLQEPGCHPYSDMPVLGGGMNARSWVQILGDDPRVRFPLAQAK